MVKNKKGFTLIELLVTIVLIISVLGIAIVSVTKISNKNKEKSWEKVKEEVEFAAMDYFDINSFELGDLKTTNASAIISVETLVSNDFLNVVTNPMTGLKVNSCDYVEVKVIDGSYSFEYMENLNNECVAKRVTVEEIGAPKAILRMDKEPDNNNFYNISDGDVNVLLDVFQNGNGPIDSIKYAFGTSSYRDINSVSSEDATYSVEANEGKGVTVTFVVTNSSGKSVTESITYSRDITPPTVTVSTEKSSWTNKNVKYTYNSSDNLGLASLKGYWNMSGLTPADSNSSTYKWNGSGYPGGKNSRNLVTKGALSYSNFNSFSAQGVRKITFKACDEAGNCTISDEAEAKIDTTPPVISSFVISSKESNYKSNQVRLSWNISDALSGIGKTVTSIKNNKGANEWNKNGAAEWIFDGKSRYFTAATSLSGATVNPLLTVYDLAGNPSVKNAGNYKIYKECSKTVEGTKSEGNFGKCSNTCGTGTKQKTVSINLNDKYTGKYCSKKTDVVKANCSDKSGCTPTISNVIFRYNSTKCPNGHVEIKYKDININKYTASMTYSHSVQGTTNTAETKDISNNSGETFCRGYGLSPNNKMTFSVVITNGLNSSKKATFKGTCNWSKMYTNGKTNSNWHACTLSK